MVSQSVLRVRVRVISLVPNRYSYPVCSVLGTPDMRPGLWCSLVLDSNCAPLCRVASLLFLAFSLHEAHGRGHERTGPEGDTAGGYIRLCVPGLSPARVTLGVRLFHMFGFVLPHGAETRSRNAKHFAKASLVPPTQFETFPTQRAMSLAFSSESRDRAASRRRLPRVAQCRGRMGLKSFSPPPPRQHPACA